MIVLLIFEDIFAPLLLTVAPFIIQEEPVAMSDIGKVFAGLLIFGVLLFIGSSVVSKQQKFSKHLLRQDDASIGLIGLILFFAGIGMMFGLSEILGAFIAGIMLADIHDVRPLKRLTVTVRDLFMPFFFISFGILDQPRERCHLCTLLCLDCVGSIISKWIVGHVGGRIYGLTRVQANEAGGLTCATWGVLYFIHRPFERDHQLVCRSLYFRVSHCWNHSVPFLRVLGRKNRENPHESLT